jgi:hypothetical protein
MVQRNPGGGYTSDDVRRELISRHGGKLAFVLNRMDRWRHRFEVTDVWGAHWDVTPGVVQVSSEAESVSEAADWALDALREWAALGTRYLGGTYFERITRLWASERRGDAAASLGTTLDWLFLFSILSSSRPTFNMYGIEELAETYCWVFANVYVPIEALYPNHSVLNIPGTAGLHQDFWDSKKNEADQVHHFVAFFLLGTLGGEAAAIPALRFIHDIRGGDIRNPEDVVNLFDPLNPEDVVNPGDVNLGILAARWGELFVASPGYLGSALAYELRHEFIR